jgi:hypothetical protein
MSRSSLVSHPLVTVALALAALLPSFAAAQPSSPVDRPAFAAGDQWVMRRIDLWTNRETARTRYEVSKLDRDGMTIVRGGAGGSDGAAATQEAVAVDPATLTFADPRRSGPRVDLAFPLAIDKEWTTEFKEPLDMVPGQLVPHTRVARVERWESVTVPAGTFDALRIAYVDRVMLFAGDGIFPAYINETLWYAPQAPWFVRREVVVRNPLKKIETQTRDELVEMRLAR